MSKMNCPDEASPLQEAPETCELALDERDKGDYVLRLYVSGMTLNSLRAIENIRNICVEYLGGRYQLEIIDIYQQPNLTKVDKIFAVPALVKEQPLPQRKFIGDMSQTDKILLALDLCKKR